MENNWVCIYTSPNMQDAEIIKGVLAFNEINSVIINKRDSSYNMFGYFEVYVNRDEAVKAKFVMKENESPS